MVVHTAALNRNDFSIRISCAKWLLILAITNLFLHFVSVTSHLAQYDFFFIIFMRVFVEYTSFYVCYVVGTTV